MRETNHKDGFRYIERSATMRPLILIAVWFVLLAMPGSLLPGHSPVKASETKSKSWLISPQQAELLSQGEKQLSPSDVHSANNELLLERDSQAGPTLEVKEPQANLAHSPMDMRIRFIPKAAPVDMSSLEVHAQKWVLGSFRGNLDLSPKVRKFLVPDGIDMKHQDIPKGRYRFALAIKDTRGAKTEAILLLQIE